MTAARAQTAAASAQALWAGVTAAVLALWAGVHIFFLLGFANRLLVSLQWAISFLTKRRGVRIFPGSQEAAARAIGRPPRPSPSDGQPSARA